jgi:hypothetical protein
MKSMAECYGSSTRHVNADGLMHLQGEVVSICPCSGDNTFVYLQKRNRYGSSTHVTVDGFMPLQEELISI